MDFIDGLHAGPVLKRIPVAELRDLVVALLAQGHDRARIPQLVGDLVEDLVKGGPGVGGRIAEALDRPVAVAVASLILVLIPETGKGRA